MYYISLKSLPKLKFAHVFSAERYENRLPRLSNLIEISYVSEGATEEIRENSSVAVNRVGDISSNLFLEPRLIRSAEFHEHHTVAFEVEFEISEQPKEGFFLIPNRLSSCKKSFRVHKLIDKIIQESQNRESYELITAGAFLELLDTLSSLSQATENESNYTKLFYVSKAKSYILSNLSSPLTQKEVADHLRITPEYLCSVFKSASGETVISFINRTKLKKIKSLMEHENLKLYEAAEMLGYSDPNYVSRLYKKLFGKNITQ